MPWFIKYKFLTRVLVIYFVHILIKGFDDTFGNYFDFASRGIIFSVFFILLWVIAWYVAEQINNKIITRRQFTRLLINIAFGYIIAFMTNAGYMFGDIYLFNNSGIWKDNSVFNPALTIGLLLFYMVGYVTSEYLQIQLAFKEKQLKTEKLEKENVIAQYKALKAQIEPHFLFNSLSVLSSIVHTDANLASDFIIKLSKTLRYIIEKNEFALVPLQEELAVVNDYFYLLKTRFNKGIELFIDIDEKSINNIYIPPASIQLLIENAVKHNKQSDEQPLQIEIKLNPDHITIQNNLNKINTDKESTSVGLQNINQRYKLLSGKEIIVQEMNGYFTVKLPVLNQSHYEDFNN